MVNRQNIQVLLDNIELANVKAYMAKSGWGLHEPDDQEVCIFTREHGEGQQRLWLWKSTNHPKFRSRVQNTIFSLAVQASREPIEIANEIYDSTVASESLEPQPNEPIPNIQLEIGNSQDHDIRVTNPGNWNGYFVLGAGQNVSLVMDDPHCSPAIRYGKESLEISTTQPNTLRFFSCRATSGPSMELISAPDWEEFLQTPESDQSTSLCAMSWERAGFDLAGLQSSSGFEKNVYKAVAVLLVSISREEQSEDREHAIRLWKLCRDILQPFGIQLEVFPGCEQELAQTAKFDRPASPSNTLDWIAIHTLVTR